MQTFTYDHDGNLTGDGVWNYTWDAENRLIAMETPSGSIGAGLIPSASARRLEFKYDYLGRRVEKIVRSGWNGSIFATLSSQHRYLYDGWNLIAEYSVTSTSPLTLSLVRSYTWGLDIVRSLASAGGVGALLQITDHGSGKSYLPAYDANGNVTALLNGDTGTSGALAASYEYGPFGELVRREITDATVAGQPFQFSTKFTDAETGLVYYGHRYYDPRNGRFLGRDPREEGGGINLYGFCGNNSVNLFDYLGLFIVDLSNSIIGGGTPANGPGTLTFSSANNSGGFNNWNFSGDNWLVNPRTGDFDWYDPESGRFLTDEDLYLSGKPPTLRNGKADPDDRTGEGTSDGINFTVGGNSYSLVPGGDIRAPEDLGFNVIETIRKNLENRFMEQKMPAISAQISDYVGKAYGGDYHSAIEDISNGIFALPSVEDLFNINGFMEALHPDSMSGMGVKYNASGSFNIKFGISNGSIAANVVFSGEASWSSYPVIFGVALDAIGFPRGTSIEMSFSVAIEPKQ